MSKFFVDFGRGVRHTFSALRALLKMPSLWPYAILPWLLGLLCYLLLGAVFAYIVLPWLDSLIQASPDAAAWWSWMVAVFRWIAIVGASLLALTVFIFTYTTLSMIISLPFIDLLAGKYEEKVYGIKFTPRNRRESLHYFWTTAINSLRINLKGIVVALLLIPVWLFVPGGVFLGAPLLGYFMGLSCVLYGAEHRRCPYREFKKQIGSARGVICGMGTINYLGMLIPFTAFLLLPVLAIAGIIVYNEEILPRQIKEE